MKNVNEAEQLAVVFQCEVRGFLRSACDLLLSLSLLLAG